MLLNDFQPLVGDYHSFPSLCRGKMRRTFMFVVALVVAASSENVLSIPFVGANALRASQQLFVGVTSPPSPTLPSKPTTRMMQPAVTSSCPRTLSDTDAYRLRREGTCVALPCKSEVYVCQLRLCHNSTHGFIALSFNTSVSSGSRSVLLRVGGPHPQTVLFEAQQMQSAIEREYIAAFRMCVTSTNYTLHVRLVTTKDTDAFTERKKLRPGGKVCPIHWHSKSILLPRYTFHGGSPNASSDCATCLWTWDMRAAAHDPKAQEAMDTLSNITMALHPWARELSSRFKALRWTPPWPNRALLPELGKREQRHKLHLAPCRRSKLCLMGDSHLRNMMNTLAELEKPGGGGCNIAHAQKLHLACRSNSYAFIEMVDLSKLPLKHDDRNPSSWRFSTASNKTSNIERLLRNTSGTAVSSCGSVVINFAHWPLSYNARRPWHLHRYK